MAATLQQALQQALQQLLPPSARPESGPGSGDQGQASAPVPPPGSVSLPEESRKLRNLIANTRQLIATACPQGYVETAALSELLEGLQQQQGACLVLGLPGHGKTALALQAMGSLAASHNLRPLRLERPEQWGWIPGEQEDDDRADSHVGQQQQQQEQQQQQQQEQSQKKPSCTMEGKGDTTQNTRRYVVLIDDVFGKGNYNEAELDAWAKSFDLLQGKVRSGQVKLILASRVHIYQACQKNVNDHTLFSEARQVDLRKPDYWTDEDKEDILRHFLSQHDVQLNISVEEIVKASQHCTEIGYPQCCRFFVTNLEARNEGLGFFEHPVRFLQNQLNRLHENDAKSYFVLVLTWLEGGLLSPETTSDASSLSALSQQCGLRETMTTPEIEAKARHLCGVYLREEKMEEEEGVFGFIHQSLQDCLVVAVCKADLKRALEMCSIQQLCEYVHTKGSSGGHAGLTHIVRRTQWPLLAARLVKVLTSREFTKAVGHPSLKNREFVSELVAWHLEVSHISQMLQQTCDTLISLDEFSPSFLFRHNKITTRTAVAALIAHGVPELPAVLLQSEKMMELSQNDRRKHLEEALVSACSVSDAALVSLLLEREAPVSVHTLQAACSSEKEDVSILRAVCQRLLEQKLDPKSLCACFRKGQELHPGVYEDLLWTCSWKGKVKSLQYLLEEARPNPSQEILDQVMTRLILKSHSDSWLNVPPRLQETLSAWKAAGAKLSTSRIDLWKAAGLPDSFALEELLSENVSTEQLYNWKKQSLLHESARCGSLQCLQVLLESPKTSSLDINALDEDKESPLHLAARNFLEMAKFLLQHGADPDGGVGLSCSNVISCGESRDNGGSWNVTNSGSRASQKESEGTTPLHLACLYHNLSLVELLIRHKARTDVLDEYRRTPLHQYANGVMYSDSKETQSGEESTRQRVETLLVQNTKNINQQDKNGATPLHLAARNGLLSLTETLLSHKARTDIVDDRQQTALHQCAWSSYRGGEDKARKRVMELLARGTGNILHQDEDGLSPLHFAAEKDNLTMMEVLLEHGVRADSVDRYERSVLHAYLNRTCCCNVRLTQQRRRLEERMLDTMADVDSPDAGGRTPLHLAARCTHMSMMEKLLQRQARVGVQDKQGRTPLHRYAESGRQKKRQSKRESELTQRVEELLVSTAAAEEAGLDTQDGSGQTVLHTAASHHHLTLVKTLIQHGARADLLDKQGRTPLHCYAGALKWNVPFSHYTPELDLEELWVDKWLAWGEVDINAQDGSGKTALHLAATANNLFLMELLMRRGARTDLLDREGMSALHCYAARFTDILSYGEDSVERWLVESSPHVGARALCGCTPLDMARQRDHDSLVELLEARTGTTPSDTASVRMRCTHVTSPSSSKTEEESPNDVTAAAETPPKNLKWIKVKCLSWFCLKSTYLPRGRRSDD